MDQNNPGEFQELNMYGGQPAQPEMPGQINQPVQTEMPGQFEQKPPRKKYGVWKFFVGAAIGIVLTLIVVPLGMTAFSAITGRSIVIGGRSSSSSLLDDLTEAQLKEVVSYIDAYYTGDYTEEDLREGILHGVVEALQDPYSEYYTAKEFADLQVSTTGSYAGIGAGLTQDISTMQVTVTKVYRGTPAEDAGILEGDMIVSVDGIDATTEELSDLVLKIRGDEGTTVHLSIYRASTSEMLELDVERRNVQLPSVEYNMLAGNIGYIQITQFQTDTASQFREAVAALEAQGMEKMIVDLRDNPGGLVDSVAEICDEILPEGLIVYTEDKYGTRQELRSDANCLNYPMVVLVNGNSASASEIFAGAMKDYGYATIIGTTTYGKGIVQTIFPLSNGTGLKITTANYFTPNGNFIHKVGIEPDIELEYEFLGGEGERYAQEYDNQLIYAQEYLMGL